MGRREEEAEAYRLWISGVRTDMVGFGHLSAVLLSSIFVDPVRCVRASSQMMARRCSSVAIPARMTTTVTTNDDHLRNLKLITAQSHKQHVFNDMS
jgi:hypothetical protein